MPLDDDAPRSVRPCRVQNRPHMPSAELTADVQMRGRGFASTTK
jgi:hypothetical protein